MGNGSDYPDKHLIMFNNTAVWQRQIYFMPVYLGCDRVSDKWRFTLPRGMAEDDQSKIMPAHIRGGFHVNNLYS